MDATAQELIARLRRNPDDSDAFAALRAHYQRIGDYASLANLLEGWAGRARDPVAGGHAMYEAGELVLSALADRERAVRMYERALALDPRREEAFLRLRGLFEDAGEVRRQAELIERHAGALLAVNADPRDVAVLYHQLGEIWEHHFTRVDKAVHHYRKAFELDPGFVAALYAAREIYRNAGNMKAAATLLEKEAKVELDPTRKVALWRELAHTRAESLDDQEGAAIALKRALGEAPGDLEVMGDLARVYLTRAERGNDEHVAASDRHRAADLLYQMAQQVPTDHALAYLEQALEARPDHDGALALYERMCDELGQPQRLPARWVAYLAQAPERPEAAYRRKRLAEAYLSSNQIDYAIVCLEWLLEEGDPEAAERLVGLYRQVGRDDDVVHALGVAARGLPPDKRLPRLRELITALRDRGDLSRAGEFAMQILELEPGDPEALHLLEDACQESGDYLPFRAALLAASRIAGLGSEQRKQRLKQVALLSERRLEDADGAISAWRGVTALDPTDVEARTALKRLLTDAQRWDDLVGVLEREALSLTEPEPKAELYRQLARIHSEQRDDLESSIVALRHLRDLLPGDLEARDALSDALVAAGAILEAVPMLRQRIDTTSGPKRAELLRLLATLLETHVGDEEGAFDCWARLLDENPTDLDALAHMEAIDETAGRHERLLSTLSYKVEVIEEAQRGAVLTRMGSIADVALRDLDRAAELYARALELSPSEAAILDTLCDVYDRAERYKDLVVLLRETANRESDAGRRAELYRRIARTLADPVGNDEGAAEAWRAVLAAGEDEEALRFLRHHASHVDDVGTLEDVLARLASLAADVGEQRDLLIERAHLLSDRLERDNDAIIVLRKVVDELQPDHVAALQKLATLSERVRDLPGLAHALWRQLAVVEDPGLRVPIARRLSDLHEREAPDGARAIEALYVWSDADLTDKEPFERLAPLLESTGRWQDLTGALDALAALELDPARISELTRRSADIAYRQLGDVDGAWLRLEPCVAEGDANAENDLRELANGAGRGRELAELYVSYAQQSADAEIQKRRWMDAAGVYENTLRAVPDALEAVLRAFAVDLSDLTYLDEADRLAEVGGAWERIAQVYETLVRRVSTVDEKVALLLRHAKRLDERAGNVSAALDHTLRACALLPHDDDVLALAEERAPRAGRAEELLVTYDKRRQTAKDDAGRVEALLRSVRLCELALSDRQRSTTYLAQAVALTVRAPELTADVEGAACALDQRPDRDGLRRAVVDLYTALGGDMEEDPVGGAHLLLRASRLLHTELGRADEAFTVIERAASYAPADDVVLDELDRFAHELARLGELDRHLHALVEDALDSRTAAGLLRRRGRLLEDELSRYDDAAEVWSRLSSVTGGDAFARERLRACLRKAGKHQDLLVALQRDLRQASDPSERVTLRKTVARVWEEDLANRWEALDAWKKVQKEDPDDADAAAALARLEQGKRERADDLDDDLGGGSDETPAAIVSPREPDSPAEDFSDLTEPSEEQALDPDIAKDSSETVMDSGLYRELMSEVEQSEVRKPPRDKATAQLRAPRETRKLSTSDARTPEPVTAEVRASRVESDVARRLDQEDGDLALEELSAPMPGRPEQEFEDDYTAVADDVFGQLRGRGNSEPEELGTGEIELLGELGSDILGAEDLDDYALIDELSGAEEIDEIDELEELDELEEIEEPGFGSSVPPPPPRGRT